MTSFLTAIRRHSGRGFSLLEIVVVLAIVAVLGAIALPRFSSAHENSAAEQAAQRIVRMIEHGRTMSRGTSTPVVFMADVANDRLQLVLDGVTVEGLTLSAKPYRVNLISADFAGKSELSIDHYGAVQASGTIRIQAGTATRTITIEASNAIIVQ